MDLLTASRIYHYGGTPMIFRLLYVFAGLLVLIVVERLCGRRLPVLRYLSAAAAVVGLAGCVLLIALEIGPLAFRCGACVAAEAVLALAFGLGLTRPASWTRVAVPPILAAAAFAYLLPYGHIPRMRRIAAGPLPATTTYLGQGGGLTVMEFADFQCEACASQDSIMEAVVERYRSRLRYAFRHLPLTNIHAYAQAAAVASECAALDGHFWEAKRAFFQDQAHLNALADHQQQTCSSRELAAARVARDVEDAHRLGLRSTPSIVIGSTLAVGQIPMPRLIAIIEDELRHPARLAASGGGAEQAGGCSTTAGCSQ